MEYDHREEEEDKDDDEEEERDEDEEEYNDDDNERDKVKDGDKVIMLFIQQISAQGTPQVSKYCCRLNITISVLVVG